eukprot:CAMPEP_0116031414 /NCGR_PEP_ID=MMETSP0321-20121206/17492_1 /TAXON_ID=163516 /ORGANISM="Leptocylindrus danicus var. danicus, Strain B650" /LENGTH=221 /DNA_ID=CAMNT_0003506519 /DNA_START=244 /DNA_END=906 /DNA_ORIENTATION=-
MLNAFRSGTKKLISPTLHQWYRPQQLLMPSPPGPSNKKSNNNKNNNSNNHFQLQWVVDIGITDRGLDDIGDINSIIVRRRRNSADLVVKRHETVLDVHWDGHIITTADELYHTVWENVEGVTSIQTPIAGTAVVFMNDGGSVAPSTTSHSRRRSIVVDEDTVLVRILVDGEDDVRECFGFVNDSKEVVDAAAATVDDLVEEGEYLKMMMQRTAEESSSSSP